MDEWLSGGIPLHGRRRNPETKEAMAVRPWSFTDYESGSYGSTMNRRTRLWIGVTLFLALAVNYIIIGAPMIRESEMIKTEMRAIMIKYAKSDTKFGELENDYHMQGLMKGRAAVSKKILLLNCASATLALLAVSWTAFGLLRRK
jgi:hypothetical protein